MSRPRRVGMSRCPGLRGLVWGGGTAALYLAAIWCAWPWPAPLRLLYDGYVPPPPYRWVHPPLAPLHRPLPPHSATGIIALTPHGSAPGSVATGDDQAAIVLPAEAFAPRAGEPSVEIRITPLDPTSIAPPPGGLRYDANAYRIDATYTVSHRPAALRAPASVILRYATGATALLRLSGRTWTALPSQRVPIALEIYGTTRALGVFAATGPPQPVTPQWVGLDRGLAAALAIAAVVLLIGLARSSRRAARRRGGGR